MQCNIDAKGKRVRLICGVVVVLAAAVLAALALLDVMGGGWVWVAVAVLAALGGFQIFEARAGWCAVRAMGFKTPV